MKTQNAKHAVMGFSLIEAMMFIVVAGIMMTTLLIATNTVLLGSPQINNQNIAVETARMCLEWFLGQRLLNGYSSYSCPSTPTSTACYAPSGFNVSTSISCATWYSDTNYYKVTVSVTGRAKASLSMQLGSY